MPTLPTLAGFSILQLLLMTIATLTILGLAIALGFFIARRYYRQDATERVTLYQRELVRQKRRTSDGNSQSTLLRRERDRARRHVQRTVRLRQSAQARAEGRPTRRAYAPVNILRPMALKPQELSGSVYEAESTLSRVRQSASAFFGATRSAPKVHDDVGELFDDLGLPAAAEPIAVPASNADEDFDRVARPQPSPLAARIAKGQSTPRAQAVATPASQFVPEYAEAPQTPWMAAGPDHGEADRVPADRIVDIPYQQPEMVAPAVPAAPAMPVLRPVAPLVPEAAPSAAPAPGARASSSDLKRRLAQVRERSAAQRAQLEELRKTS